MNLNVIFLLYHYSYAILFHFFIIIAVFLVTNRPLKHKMVSFPSLQTIPSDEKINSILSFYSPPM